MGTIRNEMTIVHHYNKDELEKVREDAIKEFNKLELFIEGMITPIMESTINQEYTFVINGECSKIGWPASDLFHETRIKWCEKHRNDVLSIVVINFGQDMPCYMVFDNNAESEETEMNNGERAQEYLKYLESIGFDYLNPNNYIRDFIRKMTPDKAEDLLHESVKFLKEINGVPYSYCIAVHPGDKERQYYKIRDYAIHVVNYFMVEKDYTIKEYKNAVSISDPERYETEDEIAKEYLNYIHGIDSLDNLSDDGLKRAFLKTFDTIRYFYQTVVAYNDIDKAANESLWEMEKIADMVRNGELALKSKNSISSNNHENEEQVIVPAAISYGGIGVKTKMLISIHPEDDILDQEFNNIRDAFNKHEASYRIIFLLREFLKRLKSIYETKDFITDINLEDYHIIFITGPNCGIQFVKDDFSVMVYTNEWKRCKN